MRWEEGWVCIRGDTMRDRRETSEGTKHDASEGLSRQHICMNGMIMPCIAACD